MIKDRRYIIKTGENTSKYVLEKPSNEFWYAFVA
jgi:hypothetical protein